MNFASMDQLTRLWNEAHRGGLPVLFLFAHSFYNMGGQTSGETIGWDRLSRIPTGLRDLGPLEQLFSPPAQMIWRTEDRIKLLASNRAAAWGERLAIVPHCEHLPQIEAAGQVNRLIGGDRP